MRKNISTILLLLFLSFQLNAQESDSPEYLCRNDEEEESESFLRAKEHLNKGISLYKAADYTGAAQEFSAATYLQPSLFAGQFNLGATYLLLKDFEKAREALRIAVELDDHSAKAWQYLADTNYRLKHTDDAVECYRKAAAIDKKSNEASVRLGRLLLSLGRFEEAEVELKNALTINPNERHAIEGLCAAYALESKSQEGVRQCTEAQNRFGSYAASYYLGWSYLDLGKFTEALTPLQKAMQAEPKKAEPYLAVAEAYSRLQQYKQALPYIRTALQVNSKSHLAYGSLGYVYARMKKKREARTAYETALKLSPDTPTTLRYNLAITCLMLNNRECALEQYSLIKSSGPGLSDQLFDLIFGSKVVRVARQ
ncbi:MAG TPA: tetratricopeptide repeat protein [Pyrinomonadaceae bacterium]